MDLLIKNMNLPESCIECDFKHFVGSNKIKGEPTKFLCECPFNNNTFILSNKRSEGCKLTAIHTAHGTLIDKEKFKKTLKEAFCSQYTSDNCIKKHGCTTCMLSSVFAFLEEFPSI